MRLRILMLVVSLGLMGLSCGFDEPEVEPFKVSTDAAGAQKAVGKISEIAMQAYLVRIEAATRQYIATQGSHHVDVQQLVEAGFLRQGQVNDPWGNPYVIKTDGGEVTVISYGLDGKPGGTGDNRDRMSSN